MACFPTPPLFDAPLGEPIRISGCQCQYKMSQWIYIAQFHTKHLNCARWTIVNRIVFNVRPKTPLLTAGSRISTGSEFQTVGPRQRRSADRVCYVDTAERSNGAGWLIFDVDRRRRRLECLSWPDTLVLCSSDTDGPWQPSCTPRVLEPWASGLGRELALTDWWNMPRKTIGMGLLYGENFIILTSTVFDWITCITNGRTDRQMDGRAIAYSAPYMLYAVTC